MLGNYRYASLALGGFGAITSATGFYLDTVCPITFNWLVWLGIGILFCLSGYMAGSLIEKLDLSSHTDYLTGLWNRRYFYLRLNEEKARSVRKKTPQCVAMVDADDFKAINDTYGHVAGDALLSDLAAVLKKNTRGTDIVVRWGGDEFVILFSEASLGEALEVMERIRHAVEAKYSSSYSLTISTGIILLEPGHDITDLLIKADQALYKAKKQKNSVIKLAEL
ncbi:GGDEF domain-containing protein [Anaeroselena agilis]|uniref:GGDEF domain-containing protein n=1 Tax=Anaeroselena agilis TaxID=3063788 RepID=A0ABU3NTZ1_9FIRM|nr:GGDEF domain-containing protein [Selenomonadales bacterium 4137-cl]